MNLANTLADILCMGKEAVYRRLRGEVSFLVFYEVLNIGMFCIRLDGSPTYDMMCNAVAAIPVSYTHLTDTRNFITDGTAKSIKIPYGIAINPETGEFFVTDAKDLSLIHIYLQRKQFQQFNPDWTGNGLRADTKSGLLD